MFKAINVSKIAIYNDTALINLLLAKTKNFCVNQEHLNFYTRIFTHDLQRNF